MSAGRRRIDLPLLSILVVAGALRLWYAVALPGQDDDRIFSDMWHYDYSGWRMAQGLPVYGKTGLNGWHPLSASTYYYPGYIYFLAAIYAVAGHSPAAVRLVQALASTATVWLVFALGARAFGRRAGLVGAALAAVYLPLVYYEGVLLTETWFIALQLLALWLWMLCWDESRSTGRGVRMAAAAGVVAGLACLTRPTFLAAIGPLGLFGLILPPEPSRWWGRIGRVLAFGLLAAAVIAPITVRNYQIHGRLILVATNAPSTFYTTHALHNVMIPPDTPKGLTDAEMTAMHRRLGLEYLRNHWPTYLAELPEYFEGVWLGEDFWPCTYGFWTTEPVADGGPPKRVRILIDETMGPPFPIVTHFPDLVRYADRVVWVLIGLPMGLLAALFLPRRPRHWSVLYLALIPIVIIPYLAFPYARFRIPGVPIVLALAGHALVVCWQNRTRWSGSPPDRPA